MLTTSAGWVRELLGIICGGLAACLLQAAIFLLSGQAERHRVEIEVLPEAPSPVTSDRPQVTPRVGAARVST